MAEIILGLPGETYASTLQTIKDLIRTNIDWLNIWTLMLLDGSELNTPKERKKWNLKTKFRIPFICFPKHLKCALNVWTH